MRFFYQIASPMFSHPVWPEWGEWNLTALVPEDF